MQTQQKPSKSKDWDTINSIFCSGTYFKNQLVDYSNGKLMKNPNGSPLKYQKRYFKPMHDTKYPSNGEAIERVTYEVAGIIRNTLTNVRDKNVIDKVMIYRNLNGGYKEVCDNKLIVTLLFNGKNFEVKYDPNIEIPAEYIEKMDISFNMLRKML